MQKERTNEQRVLLWTMLISSLTGITLWYVRGLSANPISEWASLTSATFSYFTNATNAAIVIMAATLLYGRGRLYNWFKLPAVQSAWCLYIAFVGLGFWILLGGPRGILTIPALISEITAHTFSPILGAIYFIRIVPKENLNWRHPFLWLLYPLLYLIYWLIRGPIVGYYPYYFMDVNRLGYIGAARWAFALLNAYLILGFGMLAIGRLQNRKNVKLDTIDGQPSQS